MGILHPAIKTYIQLRQSAIDNFALNPIDTQQRVFNDLIGLAQFTEYGKQYDFAHINTIKEFKSQVPVNDYDSLKPYIDRILEGAQNVLWPEPITWFAKSSGTTSTKSKFIPISKSSLDDNHFKSGKDVLALYVRQYPQSNITNGKCLTIGGSHQINQLNAESYFGDLSAVMLQNMPFVGQVMRAPELPIALMDEWEAKIEAIINSVLHANITYMAGVPTWTLVLIKKILERSGEHDLRKVWPNLELYIHGGVSFAPYRKQFEDLIPHKDMYYLETYNASEGFFAAQDKLLIDGMLLFLNHGIFYEFMPIEEYGKEHPETLQLRDIELDKNYALVVSTTGGLWRYVVGDTVKFVSTDPYRIKVSGRLKHFINAFGEEVIIDNSDYAIAFASKATGTVVNDYTAAPVYMNNNENGAHEWIVEFEHAPENMNAFTEALDNALQSVNSDYEAKRHKSIALRMPVVHVMPPGGFNRWLKSKGKLGGQHKVPRLSNNRVYIEEILPFIHQPAL